MNLTRTKFLGKKTPCYPSLRNCVCLWRTGWPSGTLYTTHGFIITQGQVRWRETNLKIIVRYKNKERRVKNILCRLQHVGQAGGAGPHDAGHPGGGDQEPDVSTQCDQTPGTPGTWQGPGTSEGEVTIQTVPCLPASSQPARRGMMKVILKIWWKHDTFSRRFTFSLL